MGWLREVKSPATTPTDHYMQQHSTNLVTVSPVTSVSSSSGIDFVASVGSTPSPSFPDCEDPVSLTLGNASMALSDKTTPSQTVVEEPTKRSLASRSERPTSEVSHSFPDGGSPPNRGPVEVTREEVSGKVPSPPDNPDEVAHVPRETASPRGKIMNILARKLKEEAERVVAEKLDNMAMEMLEKWWEEELERAAGESR